MNRCRLTRIAVLCLAAAALGPRALRAETAEARPFARFLLTNVHYGYLDTGTTDTWPVRLTLSLKVAGARKSSLRYERLVLSMPETNMRWIAGGGKPIEFDAGDTYSESFIAASFSPSFSALPLGSYRVELTEPSGKVLRYDYSVKAEAEGPTLAKMVYNEGYDGLVTLFHRPALPCFTVLSARIEPGDPPVLELRFSHPDVPPPAVLNLLFKDEGKRPLPGKAGSISLLAQKAAASINGGQGLKRGEENIVLLPLNEADYGEAAASACMVAIQAIETAVGGDGGDSETAFGSIGPLVPIDMEATP